MSIRYCYRQITYPPYLYKGFIWFTYEQNFKQNTFFTPFIVLSTNPLELAKYAQEALESSYQDQVTLLHEGSIHKLVLESHVPLKKEYWTESTHNDEIAESVPNVISQYVKALTTPTLYNTLVVPISRNRGKDILGSTIPFLKGCTQKDYDTYMTNSSLPVVYSAKNAGIYSYTEESYAINWKTKELFLPKDKNGYMKPVLRD